MRLKGFAASAFLTSKLGQSPLSPATQSKSASKYPVYVASEHIIRTHAKCEMSTSMTEPENSLESPPMSTSSPSCSGQKSKSRRLYTFTEARKLARGHGFDSKEEFMEYSCPGAYHIPKDADVVWKDDWKGWDDFLGIPLEFEEVSSSSLLLVNFLRIDDFYCWRF